MLEDAKSVHPVKASMFDRNKYLFNCANGTLDLSTLEFRPHDPEDFITKVSPINYDPDAICPRWNRFVDEVMEGHTEVSRYLQKAIGYTMTGDTSLECLFIMYGPTTRNGRRLQSKQSCVSWASMAVPRSRTCWLQTSVALPAAVLPRMLRVLPVLVLWVSVRWSRS